MSKPKPLPDQEARDRIERELDRNLLVEASAGSGKTESLARRMAAGIASAAYGIGGMAAVTFTRKAAAELRGRFQLELERRLGTETDPGRKARIQAALSGLERLFAGTIHAFCAHLIRERPVEAGVAPGFTELDEAENADFQGRAWRDFLDRKRAEGSPILREIEDADVRPSDLEPAFERVCTFSDVIFPPGDAAAPDPGPYWEGLDRFWAALVALLPAEIPSRTTCDIQKAARQFPGRLRVADRSRPSVLADLLKVWGGNISITQKWWPGTSKQTKALKATIDGLLAEFQAATVKPFLAAWRQYVYRLGVTLLSEGRGFAAEARRRALALNYGDLLQVAARLLRENLAVRSALQRKYRWLFVDEFQDTNPRQAEVILLLAAEPGPEPDWTRVRPRPGALFVVGDPKQSIYRFSGADIETYDRVRRIIEEAGGAVLHLVTSFRSVPLLCERANVQFANPAFFPVERTPQQPAYHPLAPVRAAGDARRWGIRTLTVPDSVRSSGVPAADAGAIARYIRSAVDAGKARWGDFLILTRRKRGRLHPYLAALDAYHIPAAVSGAVAFTQSREVTILASLLRVLADPDDGVALVGLLRGPLFGASDETLFAHQQSGLGFVMTARIPEDASGPVADAIRQLQSLYRFTRVLPAAAAVDRILEMTGLLARAVAATPGAAEAGDLLHALDRVRRIAEEGGTLADAADALDADLETTDAESIPLEPGRQDVVRVMNLHKAKGLEAPVVLLADPLAGQTPRADIRVIRNGPEATGYLQLIRRWGDESWEKTDFAEPAGWTEHQGDELKYVEAEEKRLLYVAATRARDLLVISRYAGKPGRSQPAWEPLVAYLAGAEELSVPGAVETPTRTLPDLAAETRSAAETGRQEKRRAAAEPSWAVESVTATAHHAGPVGHPVQAGRTREPDTGMAWGSLIHFLLEHAMRAGTRDRAHLERLASWYTFDKPELRPVVPEALDTVEGVMAADFWQRALAAEERHVEVPFAARIDGAGSAPPTILHGVIDLAFRTSAGWELIDYKTDQIVPSIQELVAGYRPQVRTYGEHWSTLVEAPVRTGLHFVRADATEWMEGS